MPDTENDRCREIDLYVGKEIKRIRKMRGIQRKLVARHLGISETQLGKYENGQNRISAGKLYMLAEYLNIAIVEFFPFEPHARLSRTESLELQTAFDQLPDDYTRSRVLDLVRCMALGPGARSCGSPT